MVSIKRSVRRWFGGSALRRMIHLALLVAVFALLADFLYYLPRVYPGVRVHQLHLGGRTHKQVDADLNQLAVTFTGPAAEPVAIPLGELGIAPDSKALFEAAYNPGRRDQRWPLYRERLRIIREGAYIPLRFQLDQETFQQRLAELESIFNAEPESAYFQVSPDERQAELIPDRPGCRLRLDELRHRFLKILVQPALPLVVPVPYDGVPADTTAASLREKGVEELMVSFSTRFDPANTNRSHNIKLAASHLHGRLLAPGEILSVNAVIGDTTPEKGYLEAPVIVGGELRAGFGGGLCQVSSTLYNAALLADLAVVERHGHQLTVPYLPPGRDATIEYGSRDFKLLNNTDHFILIHAVVSVDTLTFRLFGQAPDREVEITVDELAVYPPPTRYIYDPDLVPGREVIEEGVPGCLVEVWKAVYRNGKELSRQQISVDWYGPHPTVIRRGPPE